MANLTKEETQQYLQEAKDIVTRASQNASDLSFGQSIKQELINSAATIQDILDAVFANAGVMTSDQYAKLDEEMRAAKKKLLVSQYKLTIQRFAIIGGVGVVSIAILWYLTRKK